MLCVVCNVYSVVKRDAQVSALEYPGYIAIAIAIDIAMYAYFIEISYRCRPYFTRNCSDSMEMMEGL